MRLEGSNVCGAGGSRTRVQTRNSYAFYMLIPASIVGIGQGQDEPALSLVPIRFRRFIGTLKRLSQTLRCLVGNDLRKLPR